MAHAKCCNFDRMVEKLYGGEQWRRSKASVFWGKIAPCDHVVQIYENEQNFIHVLAQFVISGLEDGDGVIVIATSDHLLALNALFNESGINTDGLADTQYFPLVAEKVLEKFMVNGWPNEKLFNEIISSLIRKVRNNNRKVRAFGEMVAILWQQGHSWSVSGATSVRTRCSVFSVLIPKAVSTTTSILLSNKSAANIPNFSLPRNLHRPKLCTAACRSKRSYNVK